MSWQDDLFIEKSLWSVFKISRGLTGTRTNLWVSLAALLVLIIIQLLWWKLGYGHTTSEHVIKAVRLWAEIGVSFSSGILGFLLAGFSIFATMTKNEIFVVLANIPYKKGKVSRLKFIFFNFLSVFIQYLAFLFFCLFIHLLLAQDMPLTRLIGDLTQGNHLLVYCLSSLALIILGTWFVIILLMLKSFIWNIYQSVLLAIVTEDELRNKAQG